MIDHPESRLTTWLKANVIASAGLCVLIIGVVGGAIYAFGRWTASYENQIVTNQSALVSQHADIVDLDKRVNVLRERLDVIHAESDKADAALRSRLDIIDALSKYTADKANQQQLPPAYPAPSRGR